MRTGTIIFIIIALIIVARDLIMDVLIELEIRKGTDPKQAKADIHKAYGVKTLLRRLKDKIWAKR